MKRYLVCFCVLISGYFAAQAQVAINNDGSEPTISAMLDIKSTDKGLLIPRMTTTQRNSIGLPAIGLLVFDSETNTYWYWKPGGIAGFHWEEISTGANVWRTNNTTTYSFPSSQKIAIGGVSNAESQLHVGGQTGVSLITIGRSATSGGYTGMLLGTSAVSNGYNYIQSVKAGGQAGGYGNLILNPVDGNVGIGTSAPQSRLDINGTFAVQGDGANTALRVYNDGRVSIGHKAATGYWFSVNGNMICEELKVQLTTAWPDYVFQPEYKLKTFEDLRKFIKQNNHLPNIPKASVIEQDGINVGDMHKRTIEKIEELTLYILQLEERIRNLEALAND
ncbi:hypothetical protein DC498_17570 [Terrimonas sp.]|uniref:hypothetical protein n=1 Tax=Terrimonas sp. TaxID=1914338 RepID=UPI000D5225D8|nr:hypothetical protein [Terrimonas sp.]PVD50989.1 hypothetical protein DC498_17570 [Terrimonas sp.]